MASTCGERACSVYTHANARANPGVLRKMDFPTCYISLVTALFFDTVFHRMFSLDNNKIKLQKVLTGVAPYTKVQLQNMDSLVVDMCFWDAMRETETKTVTRGTSMRGKIYRNVFHDLKSLLCLFKTPNPPLVLLDEVDGCRFSAKEIGYFFDAFTKFSTWVAFLDHFTQDHIE